MDGAELRRRREALGLSLRQLGERLEIPFWTIHRWERGTQTIRHGKLLDMALQVLEEQQSKGTQTSG